MAQESKALHCVFLPLAPYLCFNSILVKRIEPTRVKKALQIIWKMFGKKEPFAHCQLHINTVVYAVSLWNVKKSFKLSGNFFVGLQNIWKHFVSKSIKYIKINFFSILLMEKVQLFSCVLFLLSTLNCSVYVLCPRLYMVQFQFSSQLVLVWALFSSGLDQSSYRRNIISQL